MPSIRHKPDHGRWLKAETPMRSAGALRSHARAEGDQRRVALDRKSEDECKRALRAGPMLTDQRLTTASKQAAENEGNDDDVVELAGDRDEVRYEVERKREVAGERDEQELLSSWNAWVAE